MPSSRIFDYLPAYARLLDEKGVLQHFAIALQTQIDDCQKSIEQAETIFDPNTCPPQWLHYTAQTVGMSEYGEHYLGVGLRAEWPAWYKRDAIQRFSGYTSLKGTEWGIREAIALWLQWNPAHDDQRLAIVFAMGDRLTRDMPGYQNDRTRYGADRLRMFPERKLIAGGDQSRSALVQYRTLSGTAYSAYGKHWSDRKLTLEKKRRYDSDGSVMATQRPRMNFYLAESEWNRVFPDVLMLNKEIWNTFASPYVYGWLTYAAPAIVLKLAPELKNLDIELDPKTGLATIYQTSKTAIVAGTMYGQRWRSKARWPAKSIAEIETGFITNEPGHRFGDQWNIAIKTGMLYRPRRRAITFQKTTQQPETIVCNPGDLIEIETGVETIEIPALWCNSNTIQSKLSAIDFSGEMPFYLDLRPVGRIETGYINIPQVRSAGLFRLDSVPTIETPWITIESSIVTDYLNIQDLQRGSFLPNFHIEMPYRIQPLYTNRSNYLDITDRIETSYITTKSAARLIENHPPRSHSFGHAWRRSPIYHRKKQPSEMTLHTGRIETLRIDTLGPIETGYIDMTGNAKTITKKIKKTFKLCNVNGYKKRSILKRITTRSKLPNSYGLFETYPIIKTVSDAANWELQFQADQVYQLRPSAMFWAKSTDGKALEDRALQPDIQTGRMNLYLEFLIDCDRDIQLENLSLRLKGKVLIGRNISQTLNLTKGTAFGVRIGVPLRFSSSSSTIANDWATWHYLQQLQDQYQDIKALQPIALPEIELPTIQPIVFESDDLDLGVAPKEIDLIKLLQQTNEGMQLIINNLTRISETGSRIFAKPLLNPIVTVEASGAVRSTFVLSSGLGNHNFTVATLTTIAEPVTEIERPVIRLVGVDSIEMTFWSGEAIGSNEVQIWICEGSKRV